MNNDLISRSSLLGGYDVRKVTEYDESGCGLEYKAVPVEAIETAPAVDAVEVVRCGSCKWFAWYVKELADQVGFDGVCNKCLCEGRKRTDYCSYGVPWEDAEVQDG